MTPLAETANRADWFRLAAQRVNNLLNRMASGESRLTTAEADIDTLQAGLTAEGTARAAADAALDGRLDALEAQSVYVATTVTFTPTTTPASPVEGLTYMDSTTHKLRTYDGTVWNDHW